VNVDHVATIREARKGYEPDPVHAAVIAEMAGADQITVHLREDRRHIQERDVRILKEVLHVPLNLEMAPTREMVEFALGVLPYQVTLVPERREEITTEGGLLLSRLKRTLPPFIKMLHDGGIQVAVFIEPDIEEVKEAKRLGVGQIEFHTGKYVLSEGEERVRQWKTLQEASRLARRLGIRVHAGHGLNYRNLPDLLLIEEIEEVNIGHAIVARSVFVGFYQAVKEMKELIQKFTFSVG
jgi:pyridoxine 5-phosphate synthase